MNPAEPRENAMKFKPCRLNYRGARYQIAADGTVCLMDGTTVDAAVDAALSAHVRAEATRLRRNRAAREKYRVMRLLGLVRCPDGSWE
jgi:hypothetical protein